MADTPLTVRDLRRLWKPHKERSRNESIAIRIHRAFSWLDRGEKLDGEADADLVLVSQWVALNALYGRWDSAAREPVPDRECLTAFIDPMLRLDVELLISGILETHKPLVLSILEDEHLARFFWREPSDGTRRAARSQRHKALSLYLEKNWTVLLDRLIERIYLLRCQLIHGAATYGSKLNRPALRRATQMLQHLLPGFLLVVIEHGNSEDWGPLCYPPIPARH